MTIGFDRVCNSQTLISILWFPVPATSTGRIVGLLVGITYTTALVISVYSDIVDVCLGNYGALSPVRRNF